MKPLGKLANCTSQVELATRLKAYYGNTVSINFDPVTISEWKKGRRLHGAPLPPPKKGNYFITKDWVEWFDEHLLQHHIAGRQEDGTAKNLAERAHEAKQLQIIHKEENERMDLERKRGKYVEVAFVERLCAGLGRWVSAEHARVENIVVDCQQWLTQLQVPAEYHGQIIELLQARLREFNVEYLDGAKLFLEQMDKQLEEHKQKVMQ